MDTVPVTILTGFLGSGKTTVLNRLLRLPELDGAVVIVNEFGEVGLDHLLIEASEEQFALLDNGCVCCTVRGDLVATLAELDRKSRDGALPRFGRVLVETTGLADPAPILHTLMAEPELARRYRIGGVVTTVDAVNGLATLERHPEAAKQVAVADRLLITKTDLVVGDVLARLEQRLAALAPTAERLIVSHGAVAAADVLDIVAFDAGDERVPAWLDEAGRATDHDGHHHDCGPDCDHHDNGRDDDHGRHHGISSCSFVIDQPIEWAAFARWLDYLTALKGEDLLRVKGLVHVAEDPERPLVLHGVQHVFHPPTRLDTWPSADRRTRLVFIVRDIPREVIERTLAKFAAIDAGRIGRPAAVLEQV
jgi:G3E family GTPase